MELVPNHNRVSRSLSSEKFNEIQRNKSLDRPFSTVRRWPLPRKSERARLLIPFLWVHLGPRKLAPALVSVSDPSLYLGAAVSRRFDQLT